MTSTRFIFVLDQRAISLPASSEEIKRKGYFLKYLSTTNARVTLFLPINKINSLPCLPLVWMESLHPFSPSIAYLTGVLG